MTRRIAAGWANQASMSCWVQASRWRPVWWSAVRNAVTCSIWRRALVTEAVTSRPRSTMVRSRGSTTQRIHWWASC